MNAHGSHQSIDESVEGLDSSDSAWGDVARRDVATLDADVFSYDNILIRRESRTISEALQRIREGHYVMNPDFQRDFMWSDERQSKLVESIVMRIPLPVIYLAEDKQGRMVVVDGLQRLSTFRRFRDGNLRIRLPYPSEINHQRFVDLCAKHQNRFEDCRLILYTIDCGTPERVRLDIFERINSGAPLARQQMRNCLYVGNATKFLKRESQTDIFREATGNSLNSDQMRDREFVNRFCAFQILSFNEYNGDMDGFLAEALCRMNEMADSELSALSEQFRLGLKNNYALFGKHAFRKSLAGREHRTALNLSFWDVMSTLLSKCDQALIIGLKSELRQCVSNLVRDEHFNQAITSSTHSVSRVRDRFDVARMALREVLDACPN